MKIANFDSGIYLIIRRYIVREVPYTIILHQPINHDRVDK